MTLSAELRARVVLNEVCVPVSIWAVTTAAAYFSIEHANLFGIGQGKPEVGTFSQRDTLVVHANWMVGHLGPASTFFGRCLIQCRYCNGDIPMAIPSMDCSGCLCEVDCGFIEARCALVEKVQWDSCRIVPVIRLWQEAQRSMLFGVRSRGPVSSAGSLSEADGCSLWQVRHVIRAFSSGRSEGGEPVAITLTG